MANVAQGAATFAIYFLTKNEKVKGLASSSGVSALLGITEPALFGVNLKYKFPFFCALIGAGVGAAFAGLMHVTAAALGSAGFLGFLSMVPKSIPMWALSVAISFIVAFGLTFVYGKRHFKEDVVEESGTVESAGDQVAQQEKAEQIIKEDKELHDEVIAAPVSGKAESLKDVNDPVFSSGAMGKGAAIKPSGNQVVAPFDGEVQIAFPTGHAYGLKSDKGAEVLIHIGIDTVSLDGKGFDAKVQANQRVKKGDVLATFDSSVITEAGLDDTTMVIVTNTADFEAVSSVATGSVVEGADFIAVK